MTGALVVAVLGLLVAAGLLAAALRDALGAAVAFGAYSLALAMLWGALRAPDVAFTEAAVGAGVTTALFVVAVARTSGLTAESGVVDPPAPRTAAGLLALSVALAATVPALPAVGDPDAPAFGPVAATYLSGAPEFGVPNAVTAVLVVYRGVDTFGEVVVVFAAGLAVAVALRRGDRR